MKIDKQLIIKIADTIKSQWKLFGLGSFIILFLLITLLVPFGSKKTPKTLTVPPVNNQLSGSSSATAKKSSNVFGFLFGEKKKEEVATQKPIDNTVKPPPNVVNELTSKSVIVQVKPDGTKTTQVVTGGAITQTTQGTINPNTNISTDLTSNEQVDNIRVVFDNGDGTTTTYIPPGTPPDDIRWARYTNNQGKYAINYPYNWQFVYSLNNGQEGVAIYPPGVNINDPKSPYVGFGLTDSFLLPAGGSTSGALITPLIVDGVNGSLYTNGPLGSSYIASILPYSGINFGLAASKSDATFAYLYYYMINSLTFNIE